MANLIERGRKQMIRRDFVRTFHERILQASAPRKPQLRIDVDNIHASLDPREKFGDVRARSAVQRQKDARGAFNFGNPVIVQVFAFLAASHGFEHAVHRAGGRGKHVNLSGLYKLACLFSGCKKAHVRRYR